MLACEGRLASRRAAASEADIVCVRRGTEQQEELRGLQIADSKETAEQLLILGPRVCGRAHGARKLHSPTVCPALVSGQGPSACPDRVRANRLEAGKAAGFLTCRIPYANLALVQANARMAPQRVFQGPVPFLGASPCRHDVRVVQKGRSPAAASLKAASCAREKSAGISGSHCSPPSPCATLALP